VPLLEKQLRVVEILAEVACNACKVEEEAACLDTVAYSMLEARMEDIVQGNSFVETETAASPEAGHRAAPNMATLPAIVGGAR